MKGLMYIPDLTQCMMLYNNPPDMPTLAQIQSAISSLTKDTFSKTLPNNMEFQRPNGATTWCWDGTGPSGTIQLSDIDVDTPTANITTDGRSALKNSVAYKVTYAVRDGGPRYSRYDDLTFEMDTDTDLNEAVDVQRAVEYAMENIKGSETGHEHTYMLVPGTFYGNVDGQARPLIEQLLLWITATATPIQTRTGSENIPNAED
jgi:hypothetical protein